jgi:[ribosomal protein S5]-alanine N-acetyltransferase
MGKDYNQLMDKNFRSNRLKFRKILAADVDDIFLLRSDKIVNTYLKREAYTSIDEAYFFVDYIQLGYENKTLLYWAMTEENDQLIGTICLWNFNREKKSAEIGYELKSNFFNKGLMSEGVSKLLEQIFKKTDLKSIEAYTYFNNTASIKMLKKFGFELDKNQIDTQDSNNRIYVLSKEKFTPL